MATEAEPQTATETLPPDVTDSGADDSFTFTGEIPEPITFGSGDGWSVAGPKTPVFSTPASEAGDIVDAVLVDDPLPRDDEKLSKPVPKSGPPTLDEWMDFFSRVVFRTLCDFYVDFAFRGVDEDEIAPRDMEKMKMTVTERREIAVPLASFANKSKIARKHGRSVIAFADSLDAIIMLGMWVSRVNRVAARYKPLRAKAKAHRKGHNSERQSQASANGNGSGTGVIEPDGLRIYNPGNGG